MKPGKKGIPRIIDAARYSAKGLSYAWINEAAFREEACLAAIMIPAALFLGQTNIERAFMILSVLIVIIVEILNSAVEAVVDRIGEEHHVLAGAAKDMGSAAVMISLIQVPIIWGLILFG